MHFIATVIGIVQSLFYNLSLLYCTGTSKDVIIRSLVKVVVNLPCIIKN